MIFTPLHTRHLSFGTWHSGTRRSSSNFTLGWSFFGTVSHHSIGSGSPQWRQFSCFPISFLPLNIILIEPSIIGIIISYFMYTFNSFHEKTKKSPPASAGGLSLRASYFPPWRVESSSFRGSSLSKTISPSLKST